MNEMPHGLTTGLDYPPSHPGTPCPCRCPHCGRPYDYQYAPPPHYVPPPPYWPYQVPWVIQCAG